MSNQEELPIEQESYLGKWARWFGSDVDVEDVEQDEGTEATVDFVGGRLYKSSSLRSKKLRSIRLPALEREFTVRYHKRGVPTLEKYSVERELGLGRWYIPTLKSKVKRML